MVCNFANENEDVIQRSGKFQLSECNSIKKYVDSEFTSTCTCMAKESEILIFMFDACHADLMTNKLRHANPPFEQLGAIRKESRVS